MCSACLASEEGENASKTGISIRFINFFCVAAFIKIHPSRFYALENIRPLFNHRTFTLVFLASSRQMNGAIEMIRNLILWVLSSVLTIEFVFCETLCRQAIKLLLFFSSWYPRGHVHGFNQRNHDLYAVCLHLPASWPLPFQTVWSGFLNSRGRSSLRTQRYSRFVTFQCDT